MCFVPVHKSLRGRVVGRKKHPKTSKSNRIAHKCLHPSLTNVCKESGALKMPR